MKKFFQKNILFFGCLGLFILAGGLLLLFTEKPQAILFFSGHRSWLGDQFFQYATKLGEEPFYLVFGLLFLLKKVRHAILIGLIGLTVTGASYGLKSVFAIDRPLAFLRKNGLEKSVNFVDGIDLHSAATSFPSGHSMSAFALYSLLVFLLPQKKRYVFPLFLTAVIVAVSRVYLVQHFWVDVYFGGLVGVLLAGCFYAVDVRFFPKRSPLD